MRLPNTLPQQARPVTSVLLTCDALEETGVEGTECVEAEDLGDGVLELIQDVVPLVLVQDVYRQQGGHLATDVADDAFDSDFFLTVFRTSKFSWCTDF